MNTETEIKVQEVTLRKAEYDDIWFLRPHDDGKGQKPSLIYGLPVWLENNQGNLECYVIKNKTIWAQVELAIRLGTCWVAHSTSIRS